MDEWEQWEARLINRIKSQPPRCLKDVQAVPNHAGEWTGLARWEIDCTCGNREGRLYGHSLQNFDPNDKGEVFYCSPLTFECASCGRKAALIDTHEHGYDAESAQRSGGAYRGSTYRGDGDGVAAPCPLCGALEQRVSTCYSHSHFDLIEDEPELEPVVQDFFDAYQCLCTCAGCGREWMAAAYELA